VDAYTIFCESLQILDPVQRAQYLERVSQGNLDLRSRVESMLANHELDDSFLETPLIVELAGETVAFANEDQPEESELLESVLTFLTPSSSPESLGRFEEFEVRAILGQGGFGIVLKAFDTRLERIVALKLLKRDLIVTSPARKRFFSEARGMAKIRHENVVAIYEVRETPRPFLVMEYVDGISVEKAIRKVGPFGISDVLRLGRQIAEGLAAAHEKKVIHRDIKPENILLETQTGRVKIADFGLARVKDDASKTQSIALVGTPLYMSPEQTLGKDLDHRSDLFSLGGVLYCMITGHPPFRAPEWAAVMQRIRTDRHRPIRSSTPQAPQSLSLVIDKLLAKNPGRRFASAGEVVTALEAISPRSSLRGVDRVSDWSPVQIFVATGASVLLAAAILVFAFSTAPIDSELTPSTERPLPEENSKSPTVAIPQPSESEQAPATASTSEQLRFVPLFNGQDFEGWVKQNSNTIRWTIQNGEIHGANSGYHPSRSGALFTVRDDYRDFHFRCEILAGRPGTAKIWFRETGQRIHGQRRGYYTPLLTANPASQAEPWGLGSVHEETFQVGQSPVAPTKVPVPIIPPTDWYKFELVARGDSIRILINGVTTTDFVAADPPARQGHIGIQCPMLSEVRVRNLEIAEFDR
jgi:serine/threonine protein kinase